tara:strand:+ start:722 stop:2788 length:2067 start_codon:yes stop_codon:yes gene_type:complete
MSVVYKLVFILIFLFADKYISAIAYDSNLSSKDERLSDSLYLDSLCDLSYDLSFNNLDSALIVIEEFLSYSRERDNLNIELGMTIKGYLHNQLGDPKTALDCFFYVLKIGEDNSDSTLISQVYNDIAMVYMELREYEKALYYNENSLEISRSQNDLKTISLTLNNYGLVFLYLEDYEKANDVFNEALVLKEKFLEEETDPDEKYYLEIDIAMLESNLGLVYQNRKQFQKAIDITNKAVFIYDKLGLDFYLIQSYTTLAELYLLIDEVSLAKKYADLSLELLGDEQFIELKANSFGVLSMVYEELNKNEIALTYKESEQVLNDSLYSLVNKEALAEAEIKYEYDKKAFSDSLVNIQKQRVFDASLEVKNAELKSQNRITNGIIFILFLIVVFSIILWLRFQKNQQEKELIKEQKNVMDDAYTELEENKIEIEKKNKEIIDSIYYARYIQRALYPDEDHMKAFFEDYVVFNLPKDIVGGDFHWFKSFGDKAIVIAADCTGHGVPGGFITVLGNLFIESSTGDHPKSPDEILSDINNELVTVLKQHEKDAIQDGMDLGICLIDKKSKKITFSGSRNGVYVVNKKGDLIEIKGDYTPVGGFYSKKEKINNRKYETHEIKLKKDEWVFMYSDGYYDQFGGDRNKSMGSTRFKNVLVHAVKNDKLQTSDFKNHFFSWMGDNDQLDDVLLMGFTL